MQQLTAIIQTLLCSFNELLTAACLQAEYFTPCASVPVLALFVTRVVLKQTSS